MKGYDYFMSRQSTMQDIAWSMDYSLKPDVSIEDIIHHTAMPSPAEHDGGYGLETVEEIVNMSGAAEYGSPLVESPLSSASEITIGGNSTTTTLVALLDKPYYLLAFVALIIVAGILIWLYREAFARMQLAVDGAVARLKQRAMSCLPAPVQHFVDSCTSWYSRLLVPFYVSGWIFPDSENTKCVHIALAVLLALLSKKGEPRTPGIKKKKLSTEVVQVSQEKFLIRHRVPTPHQALPRISWRLRRLKTKAEQVAVTGRRENRTLKNQALNDRALKHQAVTNRALKNAYRRVTSDLASKERQHASAIKKQNDDHKTATQALIQRYQTAVKQLTDRHDLAMEDLRDAHKAAEALSNTDHEVTKTRLQTSRSNNARLQREIEQLEKEVKRVKQHVRGAEQGETQMRNKYIAQRTQVSKDQAGVNRVMKQSDRLIKQNVQLRRHSKALLRSQNAKIERQANNLRNLHSSRRRMVEKFNTTTKEQEQKLAKLQDDLKSSQERAGKFEQQLEDSQMAAERVLQNLGNADKTIAQRDETINELQATKTKLETEASTLSKKLDSAESTKATSEQEKAAAATEKENLAKAKTDAEVSGTKAKNEYNTLRQDKSIIDSELKASQATNKQLVRDKANVETANKLAQSDLRKQNEDTKRECDQFKAKNENLTEENKQLKQKLQALESRPATSPARPSPTPQETAPAVTGLTKPSDNAAPKPMGAPSASSTPRPESRPTVLIPQDTAPVVSDHTKPSGDAATRSTDAPPTTPIPRPEMEPKVSIPRVAQQGEAGLLKSDPVVLKKPDGANASPSANPAAQKADTSARANTQPAAQPRTRPKPSLFIPKKGKKPLAGSSTTGVNYSSGIALPPPAAIKSTGVAKIAEVPKADAADGSRSGSNTNSAGDMDIDVGIKGDSPNESGLAKPNDDPPHLSIPDGSTAADGSRNASNTNGGGDMDIDTGLNGDAPAESGSSKPNDDLPKPDRCPAGEASRDVNNANGGGDMDIDTGLNGDAPAESVLPKPSDDPMDTEENTPPQDTSSGLQSQNDTTAFGPGNNMSIIPLGTAENSRFDPLHLAPVTHPKGPFGSGSIGNNNANPFNSMDLSKLQRQNGDFTFQLTGTTFEPKPANERLAEAEREVSKLRSEVEKVNLSLTMINDQLKGKPNHEGLLKGKRDRETKKGSWLKQIEQNGSEIERLKDEIRIAEGKSVPQFAPQPSESDGDELSEIDDDELARLAPQPSEMNKHAIARVLDQREEDIVAARPIAKPRRRRRQPASTLNANANASATAAPPQQSTTPQPVVLPETDEQKLKRLQKKLENLKTTSAGLEKSKTAAQDLKEMWLKMGNDGSAKGETEKISNLTRHIQTVNSNIEEAKEDFQALKASMGCSEELSDNAEPSPAAPQTDSALQTTQTPQANAALLPNIADLLTQHMGETDEKRMKRLQKEVARRDAYIKPTLDAIKLDLAEVRKLAESDRTGEAARLREAIKEKQETANTFEEETQEVQAEVEQLELFCD